jgi:predicted ABC-type transport system involved in lysophospholipase L1 biosynthesis ATPase subunit
VRQDDAPSDGDGFEDPDDSDIASLSGLRLSAVFQEDRLCENLSALSNIRLVCPDKGGSSPPWTPSV